MERIDKLAIGLYGLAAVVLIIIIFEGFFEPFKNYNDLREQRYDLCIFESNGKTGVIKEQIVNDDITYYFYINSDEMEKLQTVQEEYIKIVPIAADKKGYVEKPKILSREFSKLKWIVYVPEGMFMTEFEIAEEPGLNKKNSGVESFIKDELSSQVRHFV